MPMVRGTKYSYTEKGKAAANKAAAKKPADKKKRTTSADQLRQEAMRREIKARNEGKKVAKPRSKKK